MAKQEFTTQDMIGTRAADGTRTYPKVTIGGRNYNRRAVVRIRLDDTHFCVKDPTLPAAETNAKVAELKASLASKSTRRVATKDSGADE